MKAVILAGGLGTRLSEETEVKPKPLIQIGDRPIIWHIMKIYSSHGINDFIICCGYKGYLIKEYFSNYNLHNSNVTFDLLSKSVEIHHDDSEPWRVTLVDTGTETMTGGRLRMVYNFVKDEDAFCLTYGDGVGDVDVGDLISFHRSHGRLATVTAVRPPGRFGAMTVSHDGVVLAFVEKPSGDGNWINGGFFVLSPSMISRIDSDRTILEDGPLRELTAEGQLCAYKHFGFWQPMDTLRDKILLNQLWSSGEALWKTWD